MNHEIGIVAERVRKLLASELPGNRSHEKMIPETRKLLENHKAEKQAAILILLFAEGREVKFSFIQRTKYHGAHSGQISFPGGIKEESDANLSQTALRETSEETGISKNDIEIIGRLSPVFIPISRFEVHPFVGYASCNPKFRPDPVEVEFMINIPVVHFLEDRNRYIEKWNLDGSDIQVPFFQFENFKIWGATAMILSEFLDIIEEIEPDQWTVQYSGNDCNGT